MAAVNAEEVVEEVLDIGGEALKEGLIVKPALLGVAGVVTLAVGGAIGYAIAQRRLQLKYQMIAESEIDEMREHFRARLVAKEEKPNLEELEKKVEQLGYDKAVEIQKAETNTISGKDLGEHTKVNRGPAPRIPDPKDVVKNVFVEHRDEWDYQKEIHGRNELYPYVIHKDEVGEKEYNTPTFTYYEGDDVVCDEMDSVVENVDEVLGNFAANFGHGSEDPNVVYIRNDRLAFDAEVCRSRNSYAEEVHGLQHSERPRRLKFEDE